MKIWSISLIVSLLLISCAAPKAFEYRDIRNIKLDKFGFNQSSLSLELVYYNPNNFGVDLRKVDADVYIDNRYLGKMQLDTSMHIGKNQILFCHLKLGLI